MIEILTRLDIPILNLRSLFKSVKQHSHLFNLNLCCLLVAATRPDTSNQPLFNIISISHSVQLFDHLLTFEHALVAATSCDHEQQACMLATNACIKHQLNVTRSRKSCTKIAEFAFVLAFLQNASKNEMFASYSYQAIAIQSSYIEH